jgi:hypothetical protein
LRTLLRGQKLSQLLGIFLPNDVISFFHDGSPLLRFAQPDSTRTGSKNRRSTFNGIQDTSRRVGHWK